MKSHFDKPAVRLTMSTSNFPILPVAVSKCFDFSGFDLITPILKVRSPLRTLQGYRYYSQIEHTYKNAKITMKAVVQIARVSLMV